jgi:hypothetical protein
MSFRNDMIDRIEDNYSENPGLVDSAIMQVMMWTPQDLEQMDDSDPDEGFYANFTNSDLQQILSILEEEDNESRYTITLKVTAYEESVLRDAMESYSDPSFTKDRDMSTAARHILRQL